MAKDSEVKLDRKQEFVNTTPSIKIDLDLGVDKIITDLKRIQREAKNATQAIRELEGIQQEDKVARDEILNLLNTASKYGFVLTATSQEDSRGIGKTHALVEKARREGLFILVGNYNSYKYIVEQFNFPNVVNVNGYQKLPHSKYFLVDDLVPLKSLERFMIETGKEVIGGFVTDQTTVTIGKIKLKNKHDY